MVRTALVLAFLALPLRADDFYVDAVNGSDRTGTGRANAPWRTLTYALSRIPPAPAGTVHILHVLPGQYDPALGERFPLRPPPGLVILGTDPTRSFLSAGGAPATPLLLFAGSEDGRRIVARLGLHNADPAVLIRSTGPGPILAECLVSQNVAGVRVEGPAAGTAAPWLYRVRLEANGTAGLEVVGRKGGMAAPRLEASRVDGNQGFGIFLDGRSGPVQATLVNDLVIWNGGDGIHYRGSAASAPALVHLTVRGNGGAGLRVAGGTAPGSLAVRNCIVYGNTVDFQDVPGSVVVATCFGTSRGSSPPRGGQNGNLQTDPLFLPGTDATLSAVSPVLDRARVQPGLDPPRDRLGADRRTDGDGDGRPAPDPGAEEYQPLRWSGFPPTPGGFTNLILDLPTNRRRPYQIGLSLSPGPVPVPGGRSLPLSPDPLLYLVLAGRLPFLQNFTGVLNSAGYARAQVNWPPDPRLRGLTLYGAAVTLEAGFPGGVRCATNGLPLTLR